MFADVASMAVANRAYGVALFIFLLLFIGLVIVVSQAAAPFLYTVF